jgi:hypothetical protein
MRQVEVEWDEDAIEHIARHQVEPEECGRSFGWALPVISGAMAKILCFG